MSGVYSSQGSVDGLLAETVTVHLYVCVFSTRTSYTATQEDELSLTVGQLVAVLEVADDWWLGENADRLGARDSIKGGWFPARNVHAIRENQPEQSDSNNSQDKQVTFCPFAAFPGSCPSTWSRPYRRHTARYETLTQSDNLGCLTIPDDTSSFRGRFQVPVNLVAPYISLVAPLDSEVSRATIRSLTTMDRSNMNLGRPSFPSEDRYDPVANFSWPRAGPRSCAQVTGLEPVMETAVAQFSYPVRFSRILQQLNVIQSSRVIQPWANFLPSNLRRPCSG